MDAGLIDRRYATVLYDFASEHGSLDAVYADANLISDTLASTPEAQKFFMSPIRKPSEKKQLLHASFEGNVSDYTLQFLDFLVDKERVKHVKSILFVFQSLFKQSRGIRTASVTTAVPLSAQQQQNVKNLLIEKVKAAGQNVSDIDATFISDPSIIGGIILAIDGKQIDNSVAAKLKAVEKQLTV